MPASTFEAFFEFKAWKSGLQEIQAWKNPGLEKSRLGKI
jgi:hypothetical protein